MRKNKTFTLLNITGLSIGLACSLLIALYVLDELNYDKFNTKADRIYHIDEQIRFGDFSYNGAVVPAIMGPTFARDFSQIEHYTRIRLNPGIIIRKGAEYIREDKAAYADSTLFDVFTLDMVQGDKHTALIEPNSVVLTESAARKYYSGINVIGKPLIVDSNTIYKITGVIKDLPKQCHFHFNMFMSISGLGDSRATSWLNTSFYTYFVAKPGTDYRVLEKQLNKSLQIYQAPQFKETLNMSFDEFTKGGNFIVCTLMPLRNIHLRSHFNNELEVNGNIRFTFIFGGIATFILLIACINFMNLSTARSANRAKEVGVRKVLGSGRNSLILQFLAESFVTSFISFLIAIAISMVGLPWFNQLAGKQLPVAVFLQPVVLAGLLLTFIIVSLASGSYPAFLLSSFQPIKVLKGNFSTGFRGPALRNSLVVIQFTISAMLMIGTFVIYNQLSYIRNRDLGFNKEQVLLLQNVYALNNNKKAFINEIKGMPGVKRVTTTGFLPVTGSRNLQGYIKTPQFEGKNFTMMQNWRIDEQYIPVFEMKLKQGRNFSPDHPTDSGAVILNETAAKMFGASDPLNKKIYLISDLSKGTTVGYTVIGVIKDFNLNSLHEKVMPLVFNLREDNGAMALRVNTSDMPGLLKNIKKHWVSLATSQPFSYTFLDEEYGKQYNQEERRGQIVLLFAILAIFIACLGLFGLVTFAAEQRLREIGIRKVLGASVPDIFMMLSKNFVKLLLLSICIASPIAWWSMNKWLQDFAYRAEINCWIFFTTACICLTIALLTISFQAIKAAVASPVSSLRQE